MCDHLTYTICAVVAMYRCSIGLFMAAAVVASVVVVVVVVVVLFSEV